MQMTRKVFFSPGNFICRAATMAALAICSTAATGQNGAAEAQANLRAQQTAQMNYQGWLISQQASGGISAQEAQAQADAASAAAAARARFRADKARDWWGVVTVDTEDGSWNANMNASTENAASNRAIEECKDTCWPVLSFANTCVAPSYDAQGAMFWAQGKTKKDASAASLARCAARGGTECRAPVEEALCSGYRYAYSKVERADLWTGKIAEPKFEFMPAGEEYIAKPPQRRTKGTKLVSAKDEKRARLSKLARSWSAIAVEQDGDGLGMEFGLSEEDAGENALRTCGSSHCSVLMVFTIGECFGLTYSRSSEGMHSFAAKGATKDAAAEASMLACVDDGRKHCTLAVADCMTPDTAPQ